MKLEGEHKLLRVFIGEQDRWEGKPLYEAIVREARDLGMAGATVIKGVLGFGAKAHIHTAKLLELSYDMPIIIEIVDTEERIRLLLPKLDAMVQEGLVTLEKAHVIMYRANNPKRSRKSG
jgi:PII-like signaling protein